MNRDRDLHYFTDSCIISQTPLHLPSPTTASAAALSAAVCFDDIFDGSSANGTASIGHLLELQPTGIAETHVSTGVNNRVYHVLIADGAFVSPGA